MKADSHRTISSPWRPASTVLPPVKVSERKDPRGLPPAGRCDPCSYHLTTATAATAESNSTSKSSYVHHDVPRRIPEQRLNFDGAKVSGLGYAVSGLSDTVGWTTTRQASYDHRTTTAARGAMLTREAALLQSVSRNTPVQWSSESSKSYGSHTSVFIDQCKLRRRELANQATRKKDTVSRIQFA